VSAPLPVMLNCEERQHANRGSEQDTGSASDIDCRVDWKPLRSGEQGRDSACQIGGALRHEENGSSGCSRHA